MHQVDVRAFTTPPNLLTYMHACTICFAIHIVIVLCLSMKMSLQFHKTRIQR